MSFPRGTPPQRPFLCLDEDAPLGGTGERCSQQCEECAEREDLEKYGLPEGD